MRQQVCSQTFNGQVFETVEDVNKFLQDNTSEAINAPYLLAILEYPNTHTDLSPIQTYNNHILLWIQELNRRKSKFVIKHGILHDRSCAIGIVFPIPEIDINISFGIEKISIAVDIYSPEPDTEDL